MGDRVTLELFVYPQDVEKVLTILPRPTSRHDATSVHLSFDEMNYGGDDELDKLDDLGVSYAAHYGAGSTYPATVRVSVDGHHVACPSTDEMYPAVTYVSDGPDSCELEAAKEYFALLAKFKSQF